MKTGLFVVLIVAGAVGCGRSALPFDLGDGGLGGDAPRSETGGDGADGSQVRSPDGGASADRPMAMDAGPDGARALTRLEVSPAAPTLAIDTTLELGATAIYSDGTSADVTAIATFTSSATGVASVNGHTLRGVAAGTATVTAVFMGQRGTASVTVTAATLRSLSLEPADAKLAVGSKLALTATGLFSTGAKQDLTAQATWTSSSTGIASVSAGNVTAVSAGTVTIKATFMGVSAQVTVTITAATITAIDLTPSQPVLPVGISRQFQATARYSDGTTGDVTGQATWSSTNSAAIAVVADGAARGVVTTVAPGTATIRATVGSVVGSTAVTVTAATLTSLRVSPATATVSVKATQAFTAAGTYSDGTNADVTATALWSSSNEAIASLSNASGTGGLATGLSAGTVQVRATLSGMSAEATLVVSTAALSSIAVAPKSISLAIGRQQNLTVTANYSDGSQRDVTTSTSFTSSDGSTAVVSNASGSAGQITALKLGTSTITATLEGMSDAAAVTVTNAVLERINVAPATATVAAGSRQAFTSTAQYSDGTSSDVTTQATWSSDDARVATIANATDSKGTATALTAGTVTLRAKLEGQEGTASLVVTGATLQAIQVTPFVSSIRVGQSQAYQVTAVYSNGTTGPVTGATWTSSNTAVATIASTMMGPFVQVQATALAMGTTTITASSEGKTATAQLTVSAASLTGLMVNPVTASVRVGESQPFQATALFNDGSTSNVTMGATWTSSDTAVADVSNAMGGGPGGGGPGGGRGTATAKAAGSTTITAAYMGMTGSVTLTVRAAAVVTSIMISPPTASIRVGQTQAFQATALLDDGTAQNITNDAVWTSSNDSVASVSNAGGGGGPIGGGVGRGVATALTAGTVTITATYQGLSATASLTVRAASLTSISVTPPTASISVEQTQAFQAVALFDDGTDQNVTASTTWTVSDQTVASISNAGGPGGGGPGGGGRGVATALKAGTVTVTATYMSLTATASLTVTAATLTAVQVSPTNPSIAKGGAQQFTATALYSDFSTRNVTNEATWTSSDADVAPVSNAMGSIGRATGLAEGTTEVTATFLGQKGTTTLTVTGATISSIQVSPTNLTTPVGVSQRFAATAVLSDNTTQNVTAAATWTSSDTSVATVSNAGGLRGTATPVKAGTTTVTATYQGKSGSTTLTVSAAKLLSIALSPMAATLAKGARLSFTATGSYDDGSVLDLTRQATWLSSSDSVATVSNADDSRGQATGVTSGQVTVQAHFQGISGSTTLTVSP
jgi:trimeric autotransporter adhesin